MTAQSDPTHPAQRNARLLLVAAAILFIAACCFSCALAAGGLILFTTFSPSNQVETSSTPDAWVTLTVAEDGCQVQRTDVEGKSPVRSLGWVISDMDGNILLQRNADSEYTYRYFLDGSYRVYLQGWYQDRYYKLSNEVITECP